MENELVDIVCPNCSALFEARTPPDTRRGPWDLSLEEADVRCPFCEWEFRIDGNGTVSDDGEVEPEAELEIDSEGDLTVAREDDEAFPPWHGMASERRHSEVRREGQDDDGEPESDEEGFDDWMLICGPVAALCPGCGHSFKEVWLGPVWCPDCEWWFRVDSDLPETGQDEAVENLFDFTARDFTGPTPARPLIVSPTGDGDATTIGAALDRADPGRRILVRPGLYEEELIVRARVEILGDGPRDQIILVGRMNPCLTLECSTAVVRGLTLRGLGRMSNRKYAAVDLWYGQVADCDITSDSLACVQMRDGELRSCQIHDGEQAGVLGTGGCVEDCDIFHNAGPGVRVVHGGTLVISRCRIHDGYAEGVLIDFGTRGLVVDCDIFGNAKAGVTIRGDRTLLWKCRIHDGETDGLLIPRVGVGAIEHCAIFGNVHHGVRIAGGSLYAWHCRIHDGRGTGVRIRRGGVTEFHDCEICHNAQAGITAPRGARPVLRRCRIHDNHRIEHP
jgi:hypothetical protein